METAAQYLPPPPQCLLGLLKMVACISASELPITSGIGSEENRLRGLIRERNKHSGCPWPCPGGSRLWNVSDLKRARGASAMRAPRTAEHLIQYKGDCAVFFQPVLC